MPALSMHEKPRPLGMLFLNDANDLQPVFIDEGLGSFVPTGHVLSASCSPGCKDMHHRLLATIGENRIRSTVRGSRKNEPGKGIPHPDRRPLPHPNRVTSRLHGRREIA